MSLVIASGAPAPSPPNTSIPDLYRPAAYGIAASQPSQYGQITAKDGFRQDIFELD